MEIIMNVAVVGTGYVGLVSGACLAEFGHSVCCVDTNEKKVEMLKCGIIPIYEPGLDEVVNKNAKAGRLTFTTDISEALEAADVCFIAVGTPMGEDGSADLNYVLEVARSIGRYMKRHTYIVDKSTVPVGTSKKVRAAVIEELEKRGESISFDVISNPEFLKEGSALNDFMNPDRVIVGTDSKDAARVMKKLYEPCFKGDDSRYIVMDVASAEMTKYTANCMLATKISFINEIANICELVGADVNMVRLGIGSDSRIGFSFINPGCGYGGSCFPKDVQALIRTSVASGYEPRVLRAVEEVNAAQKLVISDRIVSVYGEDLSGMTFAVWGLAFKPDTDDMRCAASITIIEELTARGAKIHAYDPKAMDEARGYYLRGNDAVSYYDDKYSCLDGCDALILVTEWAEFAKPDFAVIKQKLANNVIFDGRNVYSADKMEEFGIKYYQIGAVPR